MKQRIRPGARPYGMQAVDSLAELADGIEIVVGAPLPEHGQRLMDALGVSVVVAAGAPSGCESCEPHASRGRRPPKPVRGQLAADTVARMRSAYAARSEPPRRRAA